jgi:hypothetical protein
MAAGGKLAADEVMLPIDKSMPQIIIDNANWI